MIPHGLLNCFCPAVPIQSNIPLAMATKLSMAKFDAKGTGRINAESPMTNNMLNILLPTIFPMAMSAFPFLAAITLVTSSGSDVPNATIVSPIIRLLIPISFAIF